MKWSPMHVAGKKGWVAPIGPLYAVVQQSWAGNFTWWIVHDLDYKYEERAIRSGVALTEVLAKDDTRWAAREIAGEILSSID